MNPEIKEKWLEALRSGDYTKGEGQLVTFRADKKEYCCLGVLCDLHHKMTGEGNWGVDSEGKHCDKQIYIVGSITARRSSSTTILPEKVMEWAGIEQGAGTFTSLPEDREKIKEILKDNYTEGSFTNLTEINDSSTRRDFDDVIPFIEKYF